jgi:hypothetical protein
MAGKCCEFCNAAVAVTSIVGAGYSTAICEECLKIEFDVYQEIYGEVIEGVQSYV